MTKDEKYSTEQKEQVEIFVWSIFYKFLLKKKKKLKFDRSMSSREAETAMNNEIHSYKGKVNR